MPPRRPLREPRPLSLAGRVARLLFAASLIATVFALLARTRHGLAVTTLGLDAGELAELAAISTSEPPSELSVPASPSAVPQASPWGRTRSPDDLARARAERDQMRARIYQSFGKAPPLEPAPSATGHAPYAPMPELDGGGIDPKYIQSVVHDDYFPLAKSCYAELMSRLPDAGGRLSFAFTIVGNPQIGGIVERADVTDDSTLDDPAMVTCMRESMLSMTFAPPPNGGAVTLTYPIEFSPDDADD
jgi:hypothetical protein